MRGRTASAPRSSRRSPIPSVVVAGFRVPERSVDTNAVADAFVDALDGAAGIELALEHRVTAVDPHGDATEQWYVRPPAAATGRSTRS